MKKIKAKIFIACLVVCITGSGMYFAPNISRADESKELDTKEDFVPTGNLQQVSKFEGTTSANTDYEYLNFNMGQDSTLEVEEVYAETGMEVTTQSAILKVTQSSYDTTKAELEKTFQQAENILREAELTYKTEKLALESKYATDISAGEIAEENYQNTIENLDLQVEQAKKEYDETKNIISQYPQKITDNKGKIEKKKKSLAKLNSQLKEAEKKEKTISEEYEKAKTIYEKTVKEKEDIDAVVQYIKSYQGKQGYDNGSDNKEDERNIQNLDKDSEEAMIGQSSDLQMFIEKVNSDMKEQEVSFKAAKEDYTKKKEIFEKWQQKVEMKKNKIETLEQEIETLEQNTEKKQKELADAKKQIRSLKTAYEQAVSNRENQSIEEKKELEQNLLTSQSAEVSYEIELSQLDETLKVAKDSYREAKEVLEKFSDSFIDYKWYAKESGTLNYIGYKEGDSITNKTPILGYYKDETVSIEISIDQSERATILVGDEVTVVTDSMSRGTKGVISKISHAKNSTSASKVTYGVTISVDNTEKKISNGESAMVFFSKGGKDNVE